MITKLKAILVALAVFVAVPAFAQTTVTQTTLSAAISTTTTTTFAITSATGWSASTNSQQYQAFVDDEAILVTAISGTTVSGLRGVNGTRAHTHASGATIYFGPTGSTSGSPYTLVDPPLGSCTLANEGYSLRINTITGRIWACTASQWVNVIDAYQFVGPQNCQSSVSGNSSGTNGYTSLGTAPSIPVVQASTSASGTNTHYYMCTIPPPGRLDPSRTAYVVDIGFLYGVQTNAIGTQAATLASGLMNGKTVFTKIAYPAAGASETAAGLTEAARADAGTLLITPVVASFNTATTTAGEFYSALFTPATPIALGVDRQQLQFTASFLNTSATATITNSPGFWVHYRTVVDQ